MKERMVPGWSWWRSESRDRPFSHSTHAKARRWLEACSAQAPRFVGGVGESLSRASCWRNSLWPSLSAEGLRIRGSGTGPRYVRL